MENKEAKEKIFSMLISCEISTYTAVYAPDRAVVPISNIHACIDGLTKYRARKALKELISDGVICYTSQGCPAIVSNGEYTELVADAAPPINGYCLTKKGLKPRSGNRHMPNGINQWRSGRMENREAIKFLEWIKNTHPEPLTREAIDLAISALEKQTLKKPKHIDKNATFDGNWKRVCPACGRVLVERITTPEESYPRIYNRTPHCICGQAIDWEEE